jgi:hypothetical protein
MATLRLHLFLGAALIAAAGCAQQPVRPDGTSTTSMAQRPATAMSGTAPLQAMQSAVAPTLLVFAYDQGWRQVLVSGKDYYFCRSDAPSGSLIASPRCVSETQLEFIRLTSEQQQQQLTKPIPLDRGG